MLNAELATEDRLCLDEYYQVRSLLLRDNGWLATTRADDMPHYRSTQVEEIGTHELLISEVSKFESVY